MLLMRRRDGARIGAEIAASSTGGLAVLLINDEPFPPGETAGYVIIEASPAELAELARAGYHLLRAVAS
jgi:hypothetical protein